MLELPGAMGDHGDPIGPGGTLKLLKVQGSPSQTKVDPWRPSCTKGNAGAPLETRETMENLLD